MSYQSLMQTVNTVKALELLKFEPAQVGAYVYYKCPKCQGRAVAKAYGEKKNQTYCIQEKEGGNIIQLAEQVLKMDTDSAKKFLSKVAQANEKLPVLELNYELEYNKYLEERGIDEQTAKTLMIGQPKGRTMLSGCIAFTVHDEQNNKVAYYGIRMKDGKPIHHKSFNPELYLYGFNGVRYQDDVILTTDIFECVRFWKEGKQSVCNFGLPYLPDEHANLLNRLIHVIFKLPQELKKEFLTQSMEKLEAFFRFV